MRLDRRSLLSLSLLAVAVLAGCGEPMDLTDGGPPIDAAAPVDGGSRDADLADGGPTDAAATACATHADCDDAVACTSDTCVEGECERTPRDAACNDGNECTADACGASGCEATPVPDDTACAGGDGVCTDGACVTGCGSSEECADGVACTADVCTAGACSNPPSHDACQDGNECTADACAPAGCESTPLADGATCAGGEGVCMAGACVTGCTSDAHCNDGIDCTDNACDGGVCTNLPQHERCDDTNECTADVCTVRGCESSPLAAGTPCSSGYCASGACVECSDASHCDDGVACTVDRCASGTCASEPDHARCDDGLECTADTCGASGCDHPPVADGTVCDGGSGTCQAGACAEPAGFRISTIELTHPHALADRTVCSFGVCGSVCDDFTHEDLYAQPPYSSVFVSEGINPNVQASVDALTMSWVGLFSPLHQASMFVGASELVESDCATATSCVPTSGATRVMADYTVQRSGTCLDVPASSIFGGAWPDGRTTTPNAPAAGADGCFVTDPTSLAVAVEIGGVRVTLPLTDARVAGRFVGAPATSIEDGLILGFLSQAVADTIVVSVSTSLGTVTINLGEDVLPDAGAGTGACGPRTHCLGPDARVTQGTECGWWFAFDFTADRIADVSAY